jgi:predicted lipoprotein with Yx(FWY)xxD motif
MPRKAIITVVAIVIVGAIGVGAYTMTHKSNTPPNSSTPATSSTTPSPDPNSTTPSHKTVLVTKTDTAVGKYLATSDGQALYTYDADSTGISNCTGSCLANWPAYQDTDTTTELPANVGTLKRSDSGQTQFTYKGMPLYTFLSDSSGNITGNNVENFHVAKP